MILNVHSQFTVHGLVGTDASVDACTHHNICTIHPFYAGHCQFGRLDAHLCTRESVLSRVFDTTFLDSGPTNSTSESVSAVTKKTYR